MNTGEPSPVEPTPFAFSAGSITAIEVDVSIHSLPAILRACYKLSDRLYSFVLPRESPPGGRLVVALWTREGISLSQALLGEFTQELTDQELRVRLSEQAQDIRSLIVAQAFAEGNLLEPEFDDEDYRSDPRGIAAIR